MKISLLVLREPFFDLFSFCLNNFLNIIGISKISMDVKRLTFFPKLSLSFSNRSDFLLCNSVLNTICSPDYNSEFKFCFVNYCSVNSRFRLFKYLYIKIATSKSFRIFFSDYVIFLSDSVAIDNYLFVGGNDFIKVFDYRNNLIINFAKSESIFRRNSLQFYCRKSGLSFLNPIYSLSAEHYCYHEPIINGSLFDHKLHDNLEIFEIANSFFSFSFYSSSVNLYVEKFFSSFTQFIGDNVDIYNRIFAIMESIDCKLDLWIGYTHGDLVPGNIIIDDSSRSPILLDLDLMDFRLYGFDHFIFFFNPRLNACVFNDENIFHFFECLDASFLPDLLLSNSNFLKLYFLFFLLEEHLFHLRESVSLGFESDGFVVSLENVNNFISDHL